MIRSHNGNARQNQKSTSHIPAQSRKAREEISIQLRKKKQEDRLKTRRMFGSETVHADGPSAVDTEASARVPTEPRIQKDLTDTIQVFREWKQDRGAHHDQFFAAVAKVRWLLSVQRNPPVDEVIEAGILPFLFEAIQNNDDFPDLQFEAAWAITNIASSHKTKVVAEYDGLVHELARLLQQGRTAALREQCAWCIGNVAGESPEYREGLLNLDIARDGLVLNMINPENQSLLKNVVWASSNLLRASSHHQVMDTYAFVGPLLKKLKESSTDDEELRADLCYALGYLAEGEPEHGERAQALLNFNGMDILMNVLVGELGCPHTKVLVPLVRCIGMIAIGTAEQADVVLAANFLQCVPSLMRLGSKSLQKETAWVCSNIAAGTIEQAGALVKSPQVLMDLVDAAESKHWEVRKEALWALCNLLTNEINAHTQAVIQAGAVLAFCAGLDVSDIGLLCTILDGFTVMFRYDATMQNPNLTLVVEEEGGIDKLEKLLQHRNDEVYKRSLKIIEDFFGTEPEISDEDGQNMCPVSNGGQFQFGFLPSKQLFVENSEPFDFGVKNTMGHN